MLFGMIPYFAGWRGEGYFYASLMISVILVFFALSGYRKNVEKNPYFFARSYFWATLFYLPLVLGVLLILR
jgi:heme O synthase-like polyprenyltransferase